MICDWWILIRLVCFCVSRSVACDRPVSGYNRLVCFEDFSDLSYSCHLQESNVCLLPSTKNSTHHSDFLHHSQFCFCGPNASLAARSKENTHGCIRRLLRSLQNAQRDTTNLALLNKLPWHTRSAGYEIYTFLSVASIVLSNCNASYCGMFYLLPVVSVWGKLEEIYNTLFHFYLKHTLYLLNLRHNYFASGFRERPKTKGVSKWRKIWTF